MCTTDNSQPRGLHQTQQAQAACQSKCRRNYAIAFEEAPQRVAGIEKYHPQNIIIQGPVKSM